MSHEGSPIPGLTGLSETARHHHTVEALIDPHHPEKGSHIIAAFSEEDPNGEQKAIDAVREHNIDSAGSPDMYTRSFLQIGDTHTKIVKGRNANRKVTVEGKTIGLGDYTHGSPANRRGDRLYHNRPIKPEETFAKPTPTEPIPIDIFSCRHRPVVNE
jgi:hypothetical protein